MSKISLLEQCNKKYSNRNKITSTDYRLPIDEFLMSLYLKCTPASYGKKFPLKLLGDCQRKGIYAREISDNENCGDIRICYPQIDGSSAGWFNCADTFMSFNEISEYRIEMKISYLTKNDIYNIKGIRLYQDFDFYLLCFVDSKNNFKPRFACIEKDVLNRSESITLTPLSGTKKSNINNENVVYSTSIKNGSFIFDMLFDSYDNSGYNLLKDDTYESLISFLSYLNKSAMMKYLNNKETEKKIIKNLNMWSPTKKYTYVNKKMLSSGKNNDTLKQLNDNIMEYGINECFIHLLSPKIRKWYNKDTNTWRYVSYP